MVSVIIPVYNVEAYLDRCLGSIVVQTCRNLEILLINDGSTDNSLNKCLEWQAKDKRIYVFDKINQGLGPTRNFGIDRAAGEYILFVDSDDWIAEECVELLLENAKKQDADVVIFDYYWAVSDDNGKFSCQSARRYIDLPDTAVTLDEFPQMLSRVSGTVWNKFQKTEFIRRYQLRQPAHAYEDAGYIYRVLALADRVTQVKKELYYYWINRKDSLTNLKPHTEDCKLTLQEMQDALYDTGKLGKCYLFIEKFSAVIYQICLKRIACDEKLLLLKEKAFYYSIYPKAKWIDSLAFCLIGSKNLPLIFERMRLMNSVPEKYIPDINPVYRLPEPELEIGCGEREEYQYLFFDLCGGLGAESERIKDWQTQLKRFAAALLGQFLPQNIFLLDTRLALGRGGYVMEESYVDRDKRMRLNVELEEAVTFLKMLIPDAVYLTPPEEKKLYSDIERGIPMNNYWYYDKADEVRRVLESRCDGWEE